jgi:hypothetical protein
MLARRVGRQVAGPGQHNIPTTQSQWFTTVLSGSTTLDRQYGQAGSYSATAARRQHRGPPVRHRYRPSDSTHHAVPLTECRVTDDKTSHAHVIEDIICYS